ncbi:uncharacterized protein si:dkey-9i23.16 [Nothobranchius furzeri]|uniref:uncharacterized protein si:dkey-9i23.16 n=1 Tax=Nothobranchius furzeri TaxID=105023 RepID=UPI003904C189
MASGDAAPLSGLRLLRLITWFDPESAATATILLGLFQVLLSIPMYHSDPILPNLFILSFILGAVIVAGGSFTFANERNPSRLTLYGCACSNALGLLGSLVALCVYCYTLGTTHPTGHCEPGDENNYSCPLEDLAALSWSMTLLLLLYNFGAVIMHGFLSVSVFKTLKTN